ncbi:MAG: HAD-IIA family hydrolase [Caldilineales bacterium]|nr:HAD-IIA family hydrolase [Caldilineales bacterium]MCW5860949.1 HAD-IIA family hydrolase [Caldilineales bacterium]
MPLLPPFNLLRGWLIDMDGVIYRGDEPTPGAAEFVAALQQGDYHFLFVTNNATKTPAQYVQKLAQMAIFVSEEDVFTSPLATAAYLLAHYPPPRRVLVVGGEGIRRAVDEAGYERVGRAEEAQVVIAGLDQQVTYAQLAEASLAIDAGCPFIATNPDLNVPSERGNMPGAGALLAFLEASSGKKPVVIGKPGLGIFTEALARLGVRAEDTVMLGDRLETDILGGHRAGLRTLCTLTGIASQSEAEAYNPRPDWIIPDLTALLAR